MNGNNKEPELDLYSILNATRNDSAEQLRVKYHYLALAFHPDKRRKAAHTEEKTESGGSDETFIKIEEAYKILANPVSRLIYNKFGHRGLAVYFQRKEYFEKEFDKYGETLRNPASPKELRERATKVGFCRVTSPLYRRFSRWLRTT